MASWLEGWRWKPLNHRHRIFFTVQSENYFLLLHLNILLITFFLITEVMHIQYKTLGKQKNRKKNPAMSIYHLETATANNLVSALSCTCPEAYLHIYLHILNKTYIMLCRYEIASFSYLTMNISWIFPKLTPALMAIWYSLSSYFAHLDCF